MHDGRNLRTTAACESGSGDSRKRDALCGVALGGNKVRKLEFVLAEALDQGCDTVFTTGGAQSNHAMLTAACCRRLDYLRQENDKLRDKIAQIRLVDRAKCYLIEHKGMSEAEAHRMIEKTAMDTRRDRAEVAAEILEEE